MTRIGIIALSLVCCAFGVLSLTGPPDLRGEAYLLPLVGLIVYFALSMRPRVVPVGAS